MTGSTVVYLGASRGVGFAAYRKLALTRKDVHSVLLLRSVSSFKESEPGWAALDQDVKSRTTLVEGDAFSEDNVNALLHAAGPNLKAIVFSIGFTPPSGFMKTLKLAASGFKISPPDLCCRGMIVLLKVLSENYARYNPKPKLVVVTSIGVGRQAFSVSPLTVRIMCKIATQHAHGDKLAMEVVVANSLLPPTSSQTQTLPRFFPEPSEIKPHILTPEALAAAPSGFVDPLDVCVIRGAFFTDGPEMGVSRKEGDGGYRLVQEGKESEGKGMSFISRADVGGFVAALLTSLGDTDADEAKGDEGAVAKRWWGHQVVVAY